MELQNHTMLNDRVCKVYYFTPPKPCLRGHRIWVSLIVDLLASGATEDEILGDYPGIEREDIHACLAYQPNS